MMNQKIRILSLILTLCLLLSALILPVASAESKPSEATSNYSKVTYHRTTNPESKPFGAWRVGKNTDTVIYLSDLTWESSECTYDSTKGAYKTAFPDDEYNANDGEEKDGVTLGQTFQYKKALGVHPKSNTAPGFVIYDLSTLDCDRFYATVGLTNFASEGVIFEVLADYGNGTFVSIASSDVLASYSMGEFDVELTGVKRLKLSVWANVSSASSGCVWANACVFKADATAQKPDYSKVNSATGILLSATEAAALTDTTFTFDLAKSYTIAYSNTLDDTTGDGKFRYNGNNYDYAVDLAHQIKDALIALGVTDVTVSTDADTTKNADILVGFTAYEASSKYLLALAPNQYGVAVVDGKMVIGGWSTAADMMAGKWLLENLKLSMTLGASTVQPNSNWIAAPAVLGATLAGVSECYGDGLLHYYKNASLAAFEAYCTGLKNSGYAEVFSNAMPSNTNGENNEYRMLQNAETGVRIYTYYVPDENAIRVITESVEGVSVPASADSVTRLAPISITQMQLDYATNAGGMGYVVTLEDGSFFLIDSGSTSDANQDHVRLWNLLHKLNIRPDGEIVIRGWFLTHEHDDHIMVMRRFCENYGSGVTLENIYICAVPESVAYNSKNPAYHLLKGKVETSIADAHGAKNIVSLHSGMKFSLYGLELEVLYTVEDLYPNTLHYFNNASTVVRLSTGTDTQSTDDDYRVLITGDIFTDACEMMTTRYPASVLAADMVQVAHHGNQGATEAFYEAVIGENDGVVALWPTSQTLYDLFLSDGLQTSYGCVDKALAQKTAEYHVNSDASFRFVLPYDPTTQDAETLTLTEAGLPEKVTLRAEDYTMNAISSVTDISSRNPIYLSDLPYSGTTNNGSLPAKDDEYKGTAANGITVNGTSLTFAKGIGTHPLSNKAAELVVDLSDLNIDSFYAVLVMTGGSTTGVVGEILADYGDGNGYVSLLTTTAVSSAANGTKMLEISISGRLVGAKLLKLNVLGVSGNSACACAWANAAVYSSDQNPAPTLEFYQTMKGENGTYHARLVAALDRVDLSDLCFAVTYADVTVDIPVSKVYESIKADCSAFGGYADAVISAEDLGMKYVVVIVITDIPTDVAPTFEITATCMDGEDACSRKTTVTVQYTAQGE
ncbi:MAG: NPCBM/NEW2 domain-containing protein [Clostridia bacterium]|nr:NPCBM/NEW2 domain-containing protein [Clostridia bacterium]